MTTGKKVQWVGMLAPMQPELQPIVRQLGMEGDGTLYRGRAGNVDVIATLTTMGMTQGEQAAERVLDMGVDWVMVVGIAGGVDRGIMIGDVIVPEVVLDRRTGKTYRPTPIGDIAPRGIFSTGDDLVTDPDTLAAWGTEGVVAVEMESGGVGVVCERAGVPWSVFRGISDMAADGLVDQDMFAMTNPDGTADHDAITRYLEEHPEKIPVLTQLAHDTDIATEAAAAAAIRACMTF